MTNITFTQVADFFQILATQHKTILHTRNAPRFFRSWDEALEKKGKVANVSGKGIMIVDEPDLRGEGDNADYNKRERRIWVWVLMNCDKNDFPAIDAVANSCEQIQSDLLSRIKYDAEELQSENVARYVKINDYSGERVGPLMANWYGYMFEYKITSNVNLEYDASKWL